MRRGGKQSKNRLMWHPTCLLKLHPPFGIDWLSDSAMEMVLWYFSNVHFKIHIVVNIGYYMKKIVENALIPRFYDIISMHTCSSTYILGAPSMFLTFVRHWHGEDLSKSMRRVRVEWTVDRGGWFVSRIHWRFFSQCWKHHLLHFWNLPEAKKRQADTVGQNHSAYLHPTTMNRLLLSSLGKRLTFKSTCREFSAASGLLKPYVPSISGTSLMPSSKSSSSGKSAAGSRLMSSAATAAYDQSIQTDFPSLVISANNSVEAQGPFAEAQAQVCLWCSGIRWWWCDVMTTIYMVVMMTMMMHEMIYAFISIWVVVKSWPDITWCSSIFFQFSIVFGSWSRSRRCP